MYEGPTIFDKNNNIHYRIVESPKYEATRSPYFADCNNNNSSSNNETLVLAFHSSLLCFKIAFASFFDLEKVFQCGCTSDVESEHEKRQALHDEESYDEDELHMESARDYVERISKTLATMEKNERREVFSKPKKCSRRVSEGSQTSITTVFRMSTTSSSTINNHFPSLKYTDSESTQETAAISDDEMTLESQDDDEL
eukprot:CAMPEP_0116097804 /NCGR_PEP_ID=MMETSP0327-20121206/10897_1 /TAXON_ID=44447 /ORGANISM="Pseudo-nitzschia delicatissima, Strain B596" /LENGTH=197 /DNA_ID=CAMNT_0003589573 /DNA_START=226 /DNA_END=816 /DNA_ORIENTATION=+